MDKMQVVQIAIHPSEELYVTVNPNYRVAPSHDRKYSPQEWDAIETKLLRASGYPI